MRLRRGLTAAAVLAGVYATVVRPRMMRWGATSEEVNGPYPGDALLPDSKRGSTMAVTIDAPPRLVWPWLVQMGNGRGGWYSWDRLDNFGAHSTDRIHPEWQDISVGDRLPSTPDGKHWFDVAACEPERFLALSAAFDVRGRQIRSVGLRASAYNQSVWCFQLKEVPGERTRLVVSVYASGRFRPLQVLVNTAFWEPAHWIMQTRQFRNLKQRAEHDMVEKTLSGRPSAFSSTT